MSEEKNMCKDNCCSKKCGKGKGMPSCIYGLGFIGALVYYIQQATDFQMGFIGFLKALTWPAFLIYELLKFLQM